MPVSGTKRPIQDGNRRKHDRNKFRKFSNPNTVKRDLEKGVRGIFFSCTPSHERQAFRDAVLLLGKHCESDSIVSADKDDSAPRKSSSEDAPSDPGEKVEPLSLEDELQVLRSEQKRLFSRIECPAGGAVFVQVNNAAVDLEGLVESALRDAQKSGFVSSRHCFRILPIHTTCYASAEEAAAVAAHVARNHFPPIESDDEPVTYAISLRHRLNSKAHRDDYITAIAAAIGEVDERYKVNLTEPDVTLIVEVLKTTCCIGTFRHFFELAKMNLREAACPTPRKTIQQKTKQEAKQEAKQDVKKETKQEPMQEPRQEAKQEQTHEPIQESKQ